VVLHGVVVPRGVAEDRRRLVAVEDELAVEGARVRVGEQLARNP
jgi:hypothetical protein